MISLTKCTIVLLTAIALSGPGVLVRANELLLGKTAKVTGAVDIPIVLPVEFNFKPRAEILGMRKREVLKHAQLLKGAWAPSEAVFGQVEDRKPWWGLLGQAYYGAGKDSITGPSEEARFILNPFLLVGLTEMFHLDHEKIQERNLASYVHATYREPTGLRWWPKNGKAEVTYLCSALHSRLAQAHGYSSSHFTESQTFALEAINARDLGLNYVYIPPAWAYNVKVGSPMTGTLPIPQYIHCGGSCGYPGGCNNMSPSTGWLDSFEITKLPARLSIMFWKKAPVTGREPADMLYTMNFR